MNEEVGGQSLYRPLKVSVLFCPVLKGIDINAEKQRNLLLV